FSDIEGNVVTAQITFPQGSPRATTQLALTHLAAAARRAETTTGAEPGSMIRHIYQVVAPNTLPSNQKVYVRAEHTGQVLLELPPAAERSFSGVDFIRLWRQQAGTIVGAGTIEYSAPIDPGRADIQSESSGSDLAALNTAAERLGDHLQPFAGVYSLQRLPDNNALQLDIQ